MDFQKVQEQINELRRAASPEVNTRPLECAGELMWLLRSKAFLTGTTYFFGDGEDVDFVIPREEMIPYGRRLMDYKYIGYEGAITGFDSYKFMFDGDIINIIAARPDYYRAFQMANESADKLLNLMPTFERWFMKKANRAAFFNSFRTGLG